VTGVAAGDGSGRLRLMAVHAHPDDEASKGAATLAHYAEKGVDVLVVTCTGGERGGVLNPRLAADPEVLANLTAIRRRETAAARDILGVRQTWLGFVDSGWSPGERDAPLPDGCFAAQPLEAAVARLVERVRSFRPHVLTTYDETGGYPHPDHVMCHRVAVSAFEAAGDPDRFPAAGPCWQPAKLYYDQSVSPDGLRAVHEALLARQMDSPYARWLEVWRTRPEPLVTTRVRCGEQFGRREAAMLAHATQFDPDGAWFACPVELRREAWPVEEWQLARSHVDVELPEDDLFAGLVGAKDRR
jgi:mycothiol S-conjugate amidase